MDLQEHSQKVLQIRKLKTINLQNEKIKNFRTIHGYRNHSKNQ
jgi:hypothetical protein